ncbi:acetate--CoA ligase family protein [Pseudalkalibacillus sp. A8]|uniref:acetate--CoA ligase family protein n=1 Tax=Pseudalkalibacillus sp. A8 TaxID=3382641 RepID=UPI0038B5A181
MVDTMEELVDCAWLLTSFDKAPEKGAAILTDSGAFKGFALDFCEEVGLDLPEMSESTYQTVSEKFPEFASITNPLDVTAQALMDSSLYSNNANAFLNDQEIGSLIISVLPGTPEIGLVKGRSVLKAVRNSDKPTALVLMGEGSELAEELVQEMKGHNIPLFRSPERAIRALARITEHGQMLRRIKDRKPQNYSIPDTGLFKDPFNEYTAKLFFEKAGVITPKGDLVQNKDEAFILAERLGYPVVIKAISSKLKHKSDIGGVIIGINNEKELDDAWDRLSNNLYLSLPDLALEGVLVEKMGEQGIEMVVGAKRDPDWGPVVMVGSGGVWIELFKDARFISPKLTEEEIVEEILQLKAGPLVRGFRGTKPADVKALAKVIKLVGEIMLSSPAIEEIDINPLVVYPEGQGVMAFDALIITSGDSTKELSIR